MQEMMPDAQPGSRTRPWSFSVLLSDMDLQEPVPGRLGRAGYGADYEIGAQTIHITDTAPQAAMAIGTYFDQGLFTPGSLLSTTKLPT